VSWIRGTGYGSNRNTTDTAEVVSHSDVGIIGDEVETCGYNTEPKDSALPLQKPDTE
jgi:hypothetical protein